MKRLDRSWVASLCTGPKHKKQYEPAAILLQLCKMNFVRVCQEKFLVTLDISHHWQRKTHLKSCRSHPSPQYTGFGGTISNNSHWVPENFSIVQHARETEHYIIEVDARVSVYLRRGEFLVLSHSQIHLTLTGNKYTRTEILHLPHVYMHYLSFPNSVSCPLGVSEGKSQNSTDIIRQQPLASPLFQYDKQRARVNETERSVLELPLQATLSLDRPFPSSPSIALLPSRVTARAWIGARIRERALFKQIFKYAIGNIIFQELFKDFSRIML